LKSAAETVVLDHESMQRTLVRIAHQICEQHPEDDLAIVGIHTRGAVLGRRLHASVEAISGRSTDLGDVDIALYRDDIARRPVAPVVHATHLDFEVAGKTVVIVDDVLFTGRTVRAAIDAVFDFGRPGRIRLASLCDRGHRELPIRPDYVGKNLPTSRADRVNVSVQEVDGLDQVTVVRAGGSE
jgi:pyrimidine operon attenuation protein/uracil phosphoribosyltransferase